MSKEIIVNASRKQTRIALLEDSQLAELYIENQAHVRTIGNIMLGRVRKIMPNIRAAFVDIGQKQDAFLHFSDVSENFPELLSLVGETIPEEKRKPLPQVPTSARTSDPEGDGDLEVETPEEREANQRKKKRQSNRKSGGRGGRRSSGKSGNQRRNAKSGEGAKSQKDNTKTQQSGQKGRNKATAADDKSKATGQAEKPKATRQNRRSNKPNTRQRDPQKTAKDTEAKAPEQAQEKAAAKPKSSNQRGRSSSRKPRAAASAAKTESPKEKATASEKPAAKKPRQPNKSRQTNNRRTQKPKAESPAPPAPKDTPTAFAAEAKSAEKFVQAETVEPANFLEVGQKVLVQITKEPISNKGSRITTDISMAGRFLVLVPRADYVAVSKKIQSYRERKRLRALARSLLPEGFGIIVRTVAQGRDAKSLDTDLRLLLDKWAKLESRIKDNPEPPMVVYKDVNLVSSVIRDLFTEDYDRILVDDARLYRNIKSYVQAVAPAMVPAVQHHRDRKPIFQAVGINREVSEAFESRINLPSGGYLIIEHTEAMHVVDVNSGRSGHGMTQEENALNVNLEAAELIAKHLRLRDLGGIIVVDFIDLRQNANSKKVYEALRKAFKKDRAVTKVIPMSDFGLIQITRQRLRPSITRDAVSADDRTDEEGRLIRLPSVQTFCGRIEQWLGVYKTKTGKREIVLRVHPTTAAYLRRGFWDYPKRWRMKHRVRIQLQADEHVAPLRYRFDDPASGEEVTATYDYA